MTSCTRCSQTGFLNVEFLPDEILDTMDYDEIMEFIRENPDDDVQVCDCCGDGDGHYGYPGCHYTSDDPAGKSGPYGYNGGLCECH